MSNVEKDANRLAQLHFEEEQENSRLIEALNTIITLLDNGCDGHACNGYKAQLVAEEALESVKE